MNEVLEAKGHGPLKSRSIIFKAKWHDMIHKCAPGVSDSGIVLIFIMDLKLVIGRKTIHEGEDFMACISINDLFNGQSGEVVFGTIQSHISQYKPEWYPIFY